MNTAHGFIFRTYLTQDGEYFQDVADFWEMFEIDVISSHWLY